MQTSIRAIVVYESHWGNTAAIARAIAKGLGPDACALTTAEATAAALADVQLIVAGAPLLGFSLPTEDMIHNLSAERSPTPPDLSNPSLRSWLDLLPPGRGAAATFETRIWWSPGSSAKTILHKLEELGYAALAKPQRFVVDGKYGPLRAGEIERAEAWGAELATQYAQTHSTLTYDN
jgi:flavorubredoxin